MAEETIQPKTWQEKLAQMFWGVKIGERAENLRQAARRFDNVDSLVMSTREKLLGKEIIDNNRPEGEDMHIGDDNRVTHQYMPEKKSGGTLFKLALAAGLVATGVGVPATAWYVVDTIKNMKQPATVVTPPATDADTLFDLELVE